MYLKPLKLAQKQTARSLLNSPAVWLKALLVCALILAALTFNLARAHHHEPQHIHYQRLSQAFEYYQQWSQQNAEIIPYGPTIRPLSHDERIKSIRRSLSRLGDFLQSSAVSSFYDEALVSAVKTFQKRHGLTTDGLIGNQTLMALNTPQHDRLQQIAVNLKRWQTLPSSLPQRYILVNIPAFHLQAVEQEEIVLEMPVVVGTRENKTPVFNDAIEYVDFHPFWNVPPSIAYQEILPALQQNPNYLANQHMRLFSSWREDAIELNPLIINWETIGPQIKVYKIRQDPGPWNALGQVKFVLPNQYGIYLHDTPHKQLFECTKRDFSHGCIRLRDPLSLAAFVLAQEKETFDVQKIEAIVARTQRTVIRLKKPLPVYFTYQTAWIDQQGLLNFSQDLYNWDKP